MYKQKQIDQLSEEDLKNILYLSQQGNGRRRLITNIYNISTDTLMQILIKYSTSTIMDGPQPDYS